VVIDNVLEGDEVRTDVETAMRRMDELGAENVLCVLRCVRVQVCVCV
jgi:hypothetical protein